MIAQASAEAMEKGIHGQALTPFLLGRISELTKEKSLNANISLLLNNAQLAAQIAEEFAATKRTKLI
jgi:pseudouridine-5'-phosphate glycosidase